MPRQNIIVDSVMINGGISNLAMITPLTVPINMAIRIVAISAAGTDQPLMRIR